MGLPTYWLLWLDELGRERTNESMWQDDYLRFYRLGLYNSHFSYTIDNNIIW